MEESGAPGRARLLSLRPRGGASQAQAQGAEGAPAGVGGDPKDLGAADPGQTTALALLTLCPRASPQMRGRGQEELAQPPHSILQGRSSKPVPILTWIRNSSGFYLHSRSDYVTCCPSLHCCSFSTQIPELYICLCFSYLAALNFFGEAVSSWTSTGQRGVGCLSLQGENVGSFY